MGESHRMGFYENPMSLAYGKLRMNPCPQSMLAALSVGCASPPWAHQWKQKLHTSSPNRWKWLIVLLIGEMRQKELVQMVCINPNEKPTLRRAGFLGGPRRVRERKGREIWGEGWKVLLPFAIT